eukprot:TRINITY_DN17180_c0_g1_i6.p1 TRINITY_DN17180_c0_g1~~TRINITY_DN17180_c0_g1_i6.p1  ORF type:complete len:371 (+),score=116.88 TRINITY_DN17180_c0_g1_i6:173-1285(+)
MQVMERSGRRSNISRDSVPFLAIDSLAGNSLYATRHSSRGHRKITSFLSYKAKCKKAKKTHIESSGADTVRSYCKENSQPSLNLSLAWAVEGVGSSVDGVTAREGSASDLRVEEFERTLKCKKNRLKELSSSNSNLEVRVKRQESKIEEGNAELVRIKKEILKLTNALELKSSELKRLNDLQKTLSLSLREKEAKLEKGLTGKQRELNKAVNYRSLSGVFKYQPREQAENARSKKIALDKYVRELERFEELIERKAVNVKNIEITRQMMTESVKQIQERLNNMQKVMEKRRSEIEKRRVELTKREALIEQQADPENLDLKVLVMKMYEEVLVKKKDLQDKSLIKQFNILKSMELQIKAKEAALNKGKAKH